MTTSLYEISKSLMSVMNRIDQIEPTDEDPTGELQAEKVMQEFADLQEDLSSKLENIGKYMALLNGELSGIDAEIKRLSALQKKKKGSVERLKDYISSVLQFQGIEKIEAGTFTYSFRKSDQLKVVEHATNMLPEYLKKYSLTSELSPETVEKLKKMGLEIEETAGSLNDIKNWYKALTEEEKEDFAGVVRIESVKNIQIK